MSDFYKRLSQLSENKGFKSINKFALDGLNYSSSEKLTRLGRENNKPSFEIIYDIASKFVDVNLNWLITGKGEMFGSDSMTSDDINEIYANVQESEEKYIIDNKIVNAQQKTIEVLEKVIIDLRSDKEFLKHTIEQYFSKLEH